MSNTKQLEERTKMMAAILIRDKALIPTYNQAGHQVYVLVEEIQDFVERKEVQDFIHRRDA